MKWIDQFAGWAISTFARLVSGSIVRWIERVPDDTRQRIYYANHSSHLDILLLWSAMPSAIRRKARPVAARDYWEKTPARRYLANRVFNAIMIDRSLSPATKVNPLAVIEATLKGLGDDYSLIIFPEGTRSLQEGIGPFKGGIYNIAKERPQAQLIPVYLENLNRILPKGKFIPVPLLSTITFGEPTTLQDGEKKHVFLERLKQCLIRTGEY